MTLPQRHCGRRSMGRRRETSIRESGDPTDGGSSTLRAKGRFSCRRVPFRSGFERSCLHWAFSFPSMPLPPKKRQYLARGQVLFPPSHRYLTKPGNPLLRLLKVCQSIDQRFSKLRKSSSVPRRRKCPSSKSPARWKS
ncbi:protein of unknown function [Nitrospira japonica]|uniref:Uncharacterized protein n=1 Tax=Nitrospira japonica TaxID=1325564 RepID=A0A1W1I9J2_9BACT|nr:protein of unknown function [Nitrospira japonica]